MRHVICSCHAKKADANKASSPTSCAEPSLYLPTDTTSHPSATSSSPKVSGHRLVLNYTRTLGLAVTQGAGSSSIPT
jgi:hypothetical protein